MMLRLAWHCSGTYCKTAQNGGSDGATMRFKPECDHGRLIFDLILDSLDNVNFNCSYFGIFASEVSKNEQLKLIIKSGYFIIKKNII